MSSPGPRRPRRRRSSAAGGRGGSPDLGRAARAPVPEARRALPFQFDASIVSNQESTRCPDSVPVNRLSAASRLVLFVTLALSACFSVIPYEPSSDMTIAEARATILQTFEEQPPKFRPVAVEIGTDAIRLKFSATRKGHWSGGITTVEVRESYYFSNLSGLRLIQKRNWWLILLANKESTVRREVVFYEKSKATAFLDAMNRMSSSK